MVSITLTGTVQTLAYPARRFGSAKVWAQLGDHQIKGAWRSHALQIHFTLVAEAHMVILFRRQPFAPAKISQVAASLFFGSYFRPPAAERVNDRASASVNVGQILHHTMRFKPLKMTIWPEVSVQESTDRW